MKYLPFVSAAAAAALLAACATSSPEHYASIGKSAKPPKAVAQCIASTWADKTQQPVVTQTVLANDTGADVLVPGQKPGGDAAIIRPAMQGNGTWVGYRSTSGGAPDASVTRDVNACL